MNYVIENLPDILFGAVLLVFAVLSFVAPKFRRS